MHASCIQLWSDYASYIVAMTSFVTYFMQGQFMTCSMYIGRQVSWQFNAFIEIGVELLPPSKALGVMF